MWRARVAGNYRKAWSDRCVKLEDSIDGTSSWLGGWPLFVRRGGPAFEAKTSHNGRGNFLFSRHRAGSVNPEANIGPERNRRGESADTKRSAIVTDEMCGACIMDAGRDSGTWVAEHRIIRLEFCSRKDSDKHLQSV
jgi:hypothetical protein